MRRGSRRPLSKGPVAALSRQPSVYVRRIEERNDHERVNVTGDMTGTAAVHADRSRVELYWLPLGAGDTSGCVRFSGRLYETLHAHSEHREAQDLYHSALEVHLGGDRFAIEMTPVWGNGRNDRGVVSEGAVGLPWLGRSRFFRYEIRRWRNGTIPDLSEAVAGPQWVSTGDDRAQRVLDLVPEFPTATWGRDELRTGDMWNSNSLIAWLLALSGHDTDHLAPPAHGRAPGWNAGLVVARRLAGLAPRALGRQRQRQ